MGFHYQKDFKKSWISEKIDEDGINYLSNFGLFLCDKATTFDKFPGYNSVTTSQLRNLFSEVKRIELKMRDNPDWETDVLMLRPKIAYNTARTLQRSKNSRMKELREVLELALTGISSVKDQSDKPIEERKSVEDQKRDNYIRFSKFFEGIIAYHKVNGGKD